MERAGEVRTARGSAPVRVVIADAHDLTRAGLSSLIAAQPGHAVIGQASDGIVAVELVTRLRPDVVVLDARLPGIDGVEATRRIRRHSPSTAVVLMSTACDAAALMAALRAGALGYILKDVGGPELIAVIQRAVGGEHAIEATLATDLLARMAHESSMTARPEPLTPRELEILDLISEGRTNREIASRLIVAVGTVKVHVEHILYKLGVSGRTEAAVRAVELGIVDGPSKRASDADPEELRATLASSRQ